MHGREPTFAEMILAVLDRGPATGFEIARALEMDHRLPLKGREGALYVALLELVRDGYLEAEWAAHGDGSHRRTYRLPVLQDVGADADAEGAIQ